jgi:hypothetical protein
MLGAFIKYRLHPHGLQRVINHGAGLKIAIMAEMTLLKHARLDAWLAQGVKQLISIQMAVAATVLLVIPPS